jgi:Flp pilus assembly protein TadG
MRDCQLSVRAQRTRSPRFQRSGRRPASRRGAALVEFVVCLPVIATIVLASLESCSMVFLQQSLETAAYETARTASAPNSITADALARGDQLLLDRNVQGGSVQLQPAVLEQAAKGERVTVTVTAPIDQNRIVPPWFFGSGQLSAQCVMLRE